MKKITVISVLVLLFISFGIKAIEPIKAVFVNTETFTNNIGQRVVRSGSFHETSTSWRTSFRKSYNPDYRGISVGFRIVMESE